MNRLALSFFVFLAACGGTITQGPNDAGSDSDTDVTASCNALANDAPVISIALVAQSAPPMSGGTIADGTYAMTAAEIDTGAGGESGPSGETSQVTIAVTSGTVQVATASTPGHTSVSLTFGGGASLTWRDTCPDPQTSVAQFTATATSLVVELPVQGEPGWSLVETFTKL